jgi:uncharacterized membrane protein (DUF106 family)
MNNLRLTGIGILLCGIIIGTIFGVITVSYVDNNQMKKYDLYNCIWNNAQSNSFTQNPYLIQKIQDECICFREHNYTNLSEVNC